MDITNSILTLTVDDRTYTSDIYLDGFEIKETLHNDLRPVDDNCRLKIPFNEDIADELKVSTGKDIKATVSKNSIVLFMGYLRKTYTIEKQQRHQPINLEIVSPSFLLKKVIKQTGTMENKTITAILTELVKVLPYIPSITNISTTLEFFQFDPEIEVYTIISDLLFEYGYTFKFDTSGNMVIKNLYDVDVSKITKIFNGYNITEKLVQKTKENEFNDITVNWSTASLITDTTLYENTEGRTAAYPDGCDIPISAGSYLFGNEYNYLEFDSKLGNVLYVKTITGDIKADPPLALQDLTCEGKQAKISIYNADTFAPHDVHKLRIRGTAWIEVPDQINRVSGEGKSKKFEFKYNHDALSITAQTKNIADYYRYSRITCELQSTEAAALGDLVTITESNMGTINGRIVSRTMKPHEPISYLIESISDYDSVEYTELINKASDKMNNILAIPPDVTAPTTPLILNSLVSNRGAISITFSKSTDNETGIAYYNIYRKSKEQGDTAYGSYMIVYTMPPFSESTATFTDTQTTNMAQYTYCISAVDKANNESDISNEKEVTATVTEPPKTPYCIKAEAGTTGVDLLLFIPRNFNPADFQDVISETVYFRIQYSLDGTTWNEIGRIQGNHYHFEYPHNFVLNVPHLNALKFRAFGWNTYNQENSNPIGLMNGQVKHDLANTPPPFDPPKELFTELVLELIPTVDPTGMTVETLTDKINLPKGWYYVICSAGGGASGGSGAGGKGGTWGKGAGARGPSGADGTNGFDSFVVSDDVETIEIKANGGIGGKGGRGGAGGSGGAIGKSSGSGEDGEDGEDGQDGGYIEMSFFKKKDDVNKTFSLLGIVITLKGTTLQAGTGGKPGKGGRW
jgi:hypothetical protein